MIMTNVIHSQVLGFVENAVVIPKVAIALSVDHIVEQGFQSISIVIAIVNPHVA